MPKSPSFLGKQSLLLGPAEGMWKFTVELLLQLHSSLFQGLAQVARQTDAPYLKASTCIAQLKTHTELIRKFSTNQGDQEGRSILYQEITGRNFRDELMSWSWHLFSNDKVKKYWDFPTDNWVLLTDTTPNLFMGCWYMQERSSLYSTKLTVIRPITHTHRVIIVSEAYVACTMGVMGVGAEEAVTSLPRWAKEAVHRRWAMRDVSDLDRKNGSLFWLRKSCIHKSKVRQVRGLFVG